LCQEKEIGNAIESVIENITDSVNV
jgi:hypothetical protein